MASMIQEFKTFALRGNVVDLAIGIIIGGAFGNIVSSAVADLFMPLLGLLTGKVSFSALSANIGLEGSLIELKYGMFLQSVFDFLLIAICCFLIIRAVNKATAKKEEPAPAAAPEPTESEKLLTEIRDLLKKS
jgi:large conductance mechanosensitive channel